MLKEHTLWTILTRTMSAANNKRCYRNMKYLGRKALECNFASRSVLGKVFRISLYLAKRWDFITSGAGCPGGGEKTKKKGSEVNNLPKPDEMSHWKWPFVRQAKQRSCKEGHVLAAGACEFTCTWDFASVMKVEDLDTGREFWVIQVSPIESCDSLEVEELFDCSQSER